MKFSNQEYQFLMDEFGYTKDRIDRMTASELLDLGDDCFGIEEEETVAAGEDSLSIRGETAAAIVTKINR